VFFGRDDGSGLYEAAQGLHLSDCAPQLDLICIIHPLALATCHLRLSSITASLHCTAPATAINTISPTTTTTIITGVSSSAATPPQQ
jgi:hypothetical protein